MENKELYRQKLQAQLDEWSAELDVIRAKAAKAGAEKKIELNKQIEDLEARLASGKAKVGELAEATDDAWDSVKEGVDTAWESLRSAFSDAASRFKN